MGALCYWLIHGGSTTLPSASILSAAGHTALYSAAAAALATVVAVPVSTLAIRHRNRLTILIERLSYLPMALPGSSSRSASWPSRCATPSRSTRPRIELIIAYAILFLPLAVVGVRSAMGQASPRLEEVGRSLGASRSSVFRRITLPLIAPGLGAAFALVFISSSTELTATLLLRPTGVNTLATQFWTYTTNFSYGAAAPYAARWSQSRRFPPISSAAACGPSPR